MGQLTRGLGAEYHGAGTIITYNSGASRIQIMQEGGGVLQRWQTGGNDEIYLNIGTRLKPLPANGWLYQLRSDGYLDPSQDPGGAAGGNGTTVQRRIYSGVGTTIPYAAQPLMILVQGSGKVVPLNGDPSLNIWIAQGTQVRTVPSNGYIGTVLSGGGISWAYAVGEHVSDQRSQTTITETRAQPPDTNGNGGGEESAGGAAAIPTWGWVLAAAGLLFVLSE